MKIYTVKLPICNDFIIYKWLFENIGKGVVENVNAWADPDLKWSKWDHRGHYYTYFEFRNEQDATLFSLRWA